MREVVIIEERSFLKRKVAERYVEVRRERERERFVIAPRVDSVLSVINVSID